jgi:hypothetical protein
MTAAIPAARPSGRRCSDCWLILAKRRDDVVPESCHLYIFADEVIE